MPNYKGGWTGAKNPRWNDRKSINGIYPTIYMPDHPRANKRNGFVLVHLLIIERALGKSMPAGAECHHYTPQQLVACQDRRYHMLLHQRTRALRTCGHADWKRCNYCKQYDPPSIMAIHDRAQDSYIHYECRKTKNALYYKQGGGRCHQ